MKKYILPILLLCAAFCQGQTQKINLFSSGDITLSLSYSPGIEWTGNDRQDSVKSITIKGDTMTSVRNLLVYLLQEKEENDNARILLSMINLDQLKRVFKNKTFDFYLKEYKKTVDKNKKYRAENFPIFHTIYP